MKVSRHEGSFYITHPKERRAQWVIRFTHEGKEVVISGLVEIGGKYDLEGEDDPWEIASALECNSKDKWIDTSRERLLEKIAILRDNENPLRQEWVRGKIEAKRKAMLDLSEEIGKLEKELGYLIEESLDLSALPGKETSK